MMLEKYGKTVEELIEDIYRVLPREEYGYVKIVGCTVPKVNSVKTALNVIQKDVSIGKNFYVEDYMGTDSRGDYALFLQKITNVIGEELRKGLPPELQQISNSSERLLEILRKNLLSVQPRILNKDKNTEYLKECVYRDIPGTDDLVMLYSIVLPSGMLGGDSHDCQGAVLVTNSVAERLSVSEEDLYLYALNNTYHRCTFNNLLDTLFFGGMLEPDEGFVPEDGEYDSLNDMFSLVLRRGYDDTTDFIRKRIQRKLESYARGNDLPLLYILSSDDKFFGAAMMGFDAVLETLGDIFNSDYLILPSSVHEVLVMPCAKLVKGDIYHWSSMVCNINRTNLAEDEFLSDNVYYYEKGVGLRQLTTFQDEKLVFNF